MAKIKCRYSIPYCDNALNFQDNYDGDDELHFNKFWQCDAFAGCEYYERPENTKSINPSCKYCKFREGEFEKIVQNYEYYDGTLTIDEDDREYTLYEIDYLEIDGRVLAGGDADEG